MSHFAVVPLSQKKASLFKGPIFWLDEACSLKTIDAEDLGLIKSQASARISDVIQADTKCLYIDLQNYDHQDTQIVQNRCIEKALLVEYVLNSFRDDAIICPEYVLIFYKVRKKKLKNSIFLDMDGSTDKPFKVKAGTDKSAVSGLYKISSTATNSESKILFTLRRFNQAVRRTSLEDRIVDISIAIESLIGAKTEISYQFSLFSALASTGQLDKREDRFRMFKTLYHARSGIAHGSVGGKVNEVKENILDYEELCRSVINYAIFWLAQNKNMDEFTAHLKKMALGAEGYYTPEA